MNAKRFLFFVAVFIAAITLTVAFLGKGETPQGEPITISGVTVPPLPALEPDQVNQGEVLYMQYCAGCHGANLEGSANWKTAQSDGKLLPPPQDSSGHTWHHADDLLLSIIANGGDPAYSDMPAFGDVLSDAEMRAVLTFIKNSWGQEEREFQWWVTARAPEK